MTAQASPALQAVAGAVGGCMSLSATYPLVTVTMLLQMHEKKVSKEKTLAHASAQPSFAVSPPGAMHPLRRGAGKDGAKDDSLPLGEGGAVHESSESLNTSVGPEVSSADGSEPSSTASTPSKRAAAAPAPAALPALQLVRKLVAESGGWSRLYSGLKSSLYGQVAIQALYYYFYSWFTQLLQRLRRGKSSSLDPILAASAAGALGASLTNPIWVAATRQVKTGSSRSIVAELLAMWQEDGVKSWFTGLLPALILVANPTIQYTVFEFLKKKLKVGTSALAIFLVGAVAKLAATLVTYPYIVAKTTLQSQSSTDSQEKKFDSTLACIKGVYEAEGLAGLYKGFDTKAYQSVTNSALMLLLHDRCLRVLLKLTAKAK